MLNQHSLEEIAEIHRLLEDIKKEYEEGIKPILLKNSPNSSKKKLPKISDVNHWSFIPIRNSVCGGLGFGVSLFGQEPSRKVI